MVTKNVYTDPNGGLWTASGSGVNQTYTYSGISTLDLTSGPDGTAPAYKNLTPLSTTYDGTNTYYTYYDSKGNVSILTVPNGSTSATGQQLVSTGLTLGSIANPNSGTVTAAPTGTLAKTAAGVENTINNVSNAPAQLATKIVGIFSKTPKYQPPTNTTPPQN
jgi:hypothetical protein